MECKCDYCDSNKAQPRSFYFGALGVHDFFACTDCFNDYISDEMY